MTCVWRLIGGPEKHHSVAGNRWNLALQFGFARMALNTRSSTGKEPLLATRWNMCRGAVASS